MPTITDWLMVAITAIYVVATIFICIFNGRSATATHEQVAEAKREHRETVRLGVLPYFKIKAIDNYSIIEPGHLNIAEEIKVNFCTSEQDECVTDVVILCITNLGKDLATNIHIKSIYKDTEKEYFLTNHTAICYGEEIKLIVAFTAKYMEIPCNYESKLVFFYNDCLGNSYSQDLSLNFHVEGTTYTDINVLRMDTPKFLQEKG